MHLVTQWVTSYFTVTYITHDNKMNKPEHWRAGDSLASEVPLKPGFRYRIRTCSLTHSLNSITFIVLLSTSDSDSLYKNQSLNVFTIKHKKFLNMDIILPMRQIGQVDTSKQFWTNEMVHKLEAVTPYQLSA